MRWDDVRDATSKAMYSNKHIVTIDKTMDNVDQACATLTGIKSEGDNFIAGSKNCKPDNSVDDKALVFCMVEASTDEPTTAATTTTVTTTTTTTTVGSTTTTIKPEPVPGQNLPKMPCISAKARRKRASAENASHENNEGGKIITTKTCLNYA